MARRSVIAALIGLTVVTSGLALVACAGRGEGFADAAPVFGPTQGSANASSGTPGGGVAPVSTVPVKELSPLQKKKAEMLTSIWENGTTVLQYPYCENIKDGRGYTSGRAGFCSGTGDAIQVVRCLDQSTGSKNPLHKYLPELTALDASFVESGRNQGKTSGLDAVGSYCGDWKAATQGATAAAFKGCQDSIVDKLYYAPAVAQALKWGVSRPLTIAALYDAAINHGADGVAALAKATNVDTGNSAQSSPSTSLSLEAESAWLDAFLLRRLASLKADATWAESVDRAAVYEGLRTQGNWDLSLPIATNIKAKNLYPGKGYKDSQYPQCTIAPDASLSGEASCSSATGE